MKVVLELTEQELAGLRAWIDRNPHEPTEVAVEPRITVTEAVPFRFLFLSDLHVGASEEEFYWPAIEECFYKDLENLREIHGPWDFVLFSGGYDILRE